MAERWMIYGANGYTGRLCAALAKERGLEPILAGRNGEKVRAVAEPLGLPSRSFALEDAAALPRALDGMQVVLHCAGPFSETARPMLDACKQAGAHYFDITGEIDVFEECRQRDQEWKDAGIGVIPGMGFDVVPTDCLARMLCDHLPDATHLRLGFAGTGMKLSPGTTKTMVKRMPHGQNVRENGNLVAIETGSRTDTIEFRPGEALEAMAIGWGDVATAHYTTGIGNIEVYVPVPPEQMRMLGMVKSFGWLISTSAFQNLARWYITRSVKGPTEEERETNKMTVWGEATNAGGKRIVKRCETPEGYKLTVLTSIGGVEHLLRHGLAPGYHTPSQAFGKDFILEHEGCRMIEA